MHYQAKVNLWNILWFYPKFDQIELAPHNQYSRDKICCQLYLVSVKIVRVTAYSQSDVSSRYRAGVFPYFLPGEDKRSSLLSTALPWLGIYEFALWWLPALNEVKGLAEGHKYLAALCFPSHYEIVQEEIYVQSGASFQFSHFFSISASLFPSYPSMCLLAM